MAESAKILNPEKTVILPNLDAKCPMAAMVDLESLMWMKQKHPDAAIVSYVNTTAEIKSISDICVTSSNAVNIIKKLEEKTIIFVPDTNLGKYVSKFIKDKEILIWPGICPTHHRIKKDHIISLKKIHPHAEILVHPECNPDVIELADYAFSTQGMINYTKTSQSKEFIIGTEKELCYRLELNNPKKSFYPIDIAVCPNMKKITIQHVLKCLQTLKPIVELSDDIIKNASIPLERMIEFGRSD